MHRFVSLILILVVIYSVIKAKNGGVFPSFFNNADKSEYVEGTKAPEYIAEEKIPEMEGGFVEKTISKVMLNVLKTEKGRVFLEKMIQPMNTPLVDKDYSLKMNNLNIIDSSFHVKVVSEGAGPLTAICGHSVNVTYRVVNMQDMIIESGKKSIILGESAIFKALDNIVVGMKIGESRSAVVPAKLAYDAYGFKGKKPANESHDYKVDVTLDSITSDIVIDDKVKIFDDEISFKIPVLCGDQVSFDTKILGINGDVIFDSRVDKKAMSFIVGDLSYPIIFSHALFNKQDKGTRTVISSGKYLRSFKDKNHSVIFPNEQPKIDQFYMIEFSNVAVDLHGMDFN